MVGGVWSAILSRCSHWEPTYTSSPVTMRLEDHQSSWPTAPGEHVDKVCVVAGHENMLARDHHDGNHQVGIALPPAMLLAQTFHHGRAGNVKHHDVEALSTYLLCYPTLDQYGIIVPVMQTGIVNLIMLISSGGNRGVRAAQLQTQPALRQPSLCP